MSGGGGAPKGALTRIVQLVALVGAFAMLYGATHVARDSHGALDTIAATGFLLLAGTLASEVLEPFGVPHLTGYLAAGIIAGPHVLHLMDHETVENLSQVNSLALALIALAGGAELKLSLVKQVARSLTIHSLVQLAFGVTIMTVVFVAARPLMPFTASMPLVMLLGVGLLWGTMSVSRSPAAMLGVLAQTRAKGPVTTFNLAFILTSDVIVVVLLAVVLSLVKPMIEPGAAFSVVETFSHVGHELLGSIALGTTLGLVLALYCKFVGRQLLIVLIALGFGMTEMLRYLGFEVLLTFMVAGFVVTNLSEQGDKFLHAIEEAAGVVFVVFFATAGAHLDLPLLRKLWVVAVVLSGARVMVTYFAHKIGGRLADDAPTVKKWAWAGLVSQAGLTLGISAVIERAFPSFGNAFRSLTLATVAINEMVGPVMFKFSLDRSGETSHAPEAVREEHADEAVAHS